MHSDYPFFCRSVFEHRGRDKRAGRTQTTDLAKYSVTTSAFLQMLVVKNGRVQTISIVWMEKMVVVLAMVSISFVPTTRVFQMQIVKMSACVVKEVLLKGMVVR